VEGPSGIVALDQHVYAGDTASDIEYPGTSGRENPADGTILLFHILRVQLLGAGAPVTRLDSGGQVV
jgi:hypothetical protein